MINRKELCLILLVLMFLVVSCLSCYRGGYLRHLRILTDIITILILKIKNFIGTVWFKFKRDMAEYLNVVYKLAMLASAKFIIGDADIWKVCWIASIATFTIFCYCLKICVEKKRAELTQTTENITPGNNEKVWFFTLTNGLELLLPVSYLQLAFAYYVELDPNNHPTKNSWKMVACAMKLCIIVLPVLIIVVDMYQICNTTQELENQFDAHAEPPEAVQRDLENQSIADADANVQKVAAHRDDVENQSVPDPPEVAVQIDDVENKSYADANRPEVALQIDGEK